MTTDPFEPESFGRAITAADLSTFKQSSTEVRLPRPATGEQYLGGPVPLGWLSRAGKLPGKALHLGVALWFAAIRTKGKNPAVVLTDTLAERFGLRARTTRIRALVALKRAGLVTVENRIGKAPIVTIVPAVPLQRVDREGVPISDEPRSI
jgi:hypothetical protein